MITEPLGRRKEMVHGFWVYLDESLRYTGLVYLRDDLQREEALTLFDAAKLKGEAYFEDDQDRDFALIYNRNDGTYELIQRTRE